ncbi:hypothetical protein BCR42DRAFT_410057 [Absidia repens]|uniref:Uncharacterized protein n=1 Tax=Absidia repens TaxID=90262 RepID=A0A1X2IPZ4_9FUNG|nr:hypothetical protein BCR42DRAFT_410057 [Absidia repens]
MKFIYTLYTMCILILKPLSRCSFFLKTKIVFRRRCFFYKMDIYPYFLTCCPFSTFRISLLLFLQGVGESMVGDAPVERDMYLLTFL